MAQEQPELIKDAKALRALAHPVRWRLLQLLDEQDSLTATRCAELTGESVASCSYHLNTLAKYGYIEQAEGGQGREKPWQSTSVEQSWSTSGSDMDTESVLAAEAATDVFIDAEADRLKRLIRRPPGTEPSQWQETNTITGATAWLSAEEARALCAELQEIGRRYEHRARDRAARPDGARNFRLFLAMSPSSTPPQDRS